MANILIVDDAKNIRDHLASYVRRLGHRVRSAADGAEALALVQAEPFDLVFTDVRMAGLDGLALLREIRARRPETIVVLMTAYGTVQQAAVYLRDDLSAGAGFDGPAIIIEETSTIVLEPGWRATLTDLGDLEFESDLSHAARTENATRAAQAPDAITLELFNNHFASIVEQMGATLQKTALSTNVKERLDFSCAIFTASGDLVVSTSTPARRRQKRGTRPRWKASEAIAACFRPTKL